MANPWKRFRDYIDELEEAMRMAGVELEDLERESARRNEKADWRQGQREAVAGQLLAKAHDIPFFAQLLEYAATLAPDQELPPAPGELSPWLDGEQEDRRDSSHRGSPPRASDLDSVPAESQTALDPPLEPSTAAGASLGSAPARLRSAERALCQRTRSLIPVLEELVTPRNASAIVRSAEALGLQEIHFVDRRGKARLNRAVTRKCQNWMDLRWHREPGQLVRELRRRGYTLLAADFGPRSQPLHELSVEGPTAIVLGSEQRGVSAEMREAVDGLFHLPTSGFTSYLNVSVTAGIALHDLDRRLRAAGLRQALPADEQNMIRRAWYALLAGKNEARRLEYARWAEDPPEAAPLTRAVPSREKLREEGG